MKTYDFIYFLILLSSIILAQKISSYAVTIDENFLLHFACTISIGLFLSCIGLGGFHALFKEEDNDENNNENGINKENKNEDK